MGLQRTLEGIFEVMSQSELGRPADPRESALSKEASEVPDLQVPGSAAVRALQLVRSIRSAARRTARVMRWPFFAVLALAVPAWLISKTELVDLDAHDGYVRLMLEVQEINGSLDGDLSRARHVDLLSYEGMAAKMAGLESRVGKLAIPPRFLDGRSAGYRRVADGLRDLLEAVQAKKRLLQRFESERSLLHGSLSSAATAATELVQETKGSDPVLAAKVQDLVREAEVYDLEASKESGPRVDGEIASLAESHGHLAPSAQTDLERVLEWCRGIQSHKSQLDELTGSALAAPVGPGLRNLEATYGKEYLRLAAVTNDYRLVLYLFVLLLIATVTYSLFRLRAAARAFRETSESLEKRVEERTLHLDRTVESLERANEELAKLSRTDELTGLANRRCFDEKLEAEWQRHRRDRKPISLVLGDVDFFKHFNDVYGHLAGDECLSAVGAALRRLLKRPADLAARYGGEEFVMVLPSTHAEGARHLAELARAEVEHLSVARASGGVTLSIGVATLVPGKGPATDLTRLADEALYLAKSKGRNRVVVAPLGRSHSTSER